MNEPSWIPCEYCEEYFCTIHKMHVADCDCPPIDDWIDENPYETPEEAEQCP
jgi:predicted nucleic acid binding AN1-type Zn finger protein